MTLTFSIPLATEDFYPNAIRCIATDGDAITIQPQSTATTIWLDEIETKYWNREREAHASGDYEFLHSIYDFNYTPYTF